MIRMNCRVIGVALLTTMLAAPQIAMAGFEWTPPPAPPELSDDSALPALTPEMPAMPAADVDAATLDQQPAVMSTVQPAPAINPEPLAQGISRTKPPMSAAMLSAIQSGPESMTSPAMPVPAMPQSSTYAEAVGFGSDMPLAFAMRQIVPPEYAFAFDPSVDHGARVSWNGGKPWDMVLTETLLPLGLASVVDGKTVRVVPIGSVPAQMPAMAAAPVPYMPPASMPAYQAAPPSPMQTITPMQSAAAQPEPAREVYIRRDEKSSGGPKEEKSFWSRLGFGGDDDDNAWKKKPRAEQRQPDPALAPQPLFQPEPQHFAEPMTPPPVPEPVPFAETSPAETPYGPVPLVEQRISYAENTAPMPPAAAITAEPVPVMPVAGQVSAPVAEPVSVPAYVPPALPEAAPAASTEPAQEPLQAEQQQQAAAELPVDLYEIRYWQAEKGDSLRNVLSTWSKTASVELYWSPEADYSLPESIRLHGSYTDAVTRLLSLYEEKSERPLGRLHPNLPQGPSVLVVEQYRTNS